MNLWDKLREPGLMRTLSDALKGWEEPVSIMEVCGTHTMAIARWGLRKMLPGSIRLISGPGCPVCVTPDSMIDALFGLKDVIIATFGDLIRVPGRNGTLEQARAQGLDVRMVYSPMDAVEFAREKETVFVAIGFETTAPSIAYTVQYCHNNKIKNFSVLSCLKTIPPALDALLSSRDARIDGFILPGNVSTIIGSHAYDFIPEKYRKGGVITGFEPAEILMSLKMLLSQISLKRPGIEIEYKSYARENGNEKALSLISQVFSLEDSDWRGLGRIKGSGLGLRDMYRDFDARVKYNIPSPVNLEEKKGCQCGEVLLGRILPIECRLFRNTCTPENPLGPCMVSSEGSCAAYYKYET